MTESSRALTTQPAASLPTATEWATVKDMATTLVASRMLPEAVKTPEAATAIIIKGRELGIPAMQAFSHIHIIKGKPTCSSELQLALLARGGVTWKWLKDGSNGEIAEVEFHREGFDACSGSYSMGEAQVAGLTRNPVWKQYPANMLRARAISNGARMIGPDLLSGMSYTPEEMGAAVNADGEPIEVTAEVVETKPLEERKPTKREKIAPEPEEIDFDAGKKGTLREAIKGLEEAIALSPVHLRNARRKYAGSVELKECDVKRLEDYVVKLQEKWDAKQGGGDAQR